MVIRQFRVFRTSTDYLYGVSDKETAADITISAAEDPDLFLLVQTAQTNKAMIPRLLAYMDLLQREDKKAVAP